MKQVALLLFISIYLVVPQTILAAIGLPSQPKTGQGINPGSGNAIGDLGTVINNTISLLFTIGGIGFVIMIIWGAVNWILSGGDKEKIGAARRRITTAIIGLVILSLTFVAMIVIGQVLGIESLYSGQFKIKGLLDE